MERRRIRIDPVAGRVITVAGGADTDWRCRYVEPSAQCPRHGEPPEGQR